MKAWWFAALALGFLAVHARAQEPAKDAPKPEASPEAKPGPAPQAPPAAKPDAGAEAKPPAANPEPDPGAKVEPAPAAAAPPKPESPLKSLKDKVSYSIGLDIGRNFKNQSIDVDPDLLAKGIRDVLSGAALLMTDEEMREVMTVFQKEMAARQAERMKQLAEKNKKEGEAFLVANKAKEGVVTLASGLQYKVIKAGDGKVPKATDSVTTHYRGTLLDGTEFDSSLKRGQPAKFQVGGVIPGWKEALQLMGVGSKWQLFVPSPLAYGERGSGRVIGPNATLVFEVELLGIQ